MGPRPKYVRFLRSFGSSKVVPRQGKGGSVRSGVKVAHRSMLPSGRKVAVYSVVMLPSRVCVTKVALETTAPSAFVVKTGPAVRVCRCWSSCCCFQSLAIQLPNPLSLSVGARKKCGEREEKNDEQVMGCFLLFTF